MDVFYFPTSVSPLIEHQPLRHFHPALHPGALPEELSGISKIFPIPHPQQAPEDLQTINCLNSCSWQLCSASAPCWGKKKDPSQRKKKQGALVIVPPLLEHRPSTAGALSLHGLVRNTAQLGKVVQGKLLV